MPDLILSPDERFWSRVDMRDDNECWNWLAAIDAYGYGSATHSGRTRKAHRIAWTIANGPIPEGLWVLHHCDNRKCCNPAHLYVGTNDDNMRDMRERGRAKSQPPKGEASPNAKLSEEDVREIRQLHAQGVFQEVLAQRYGVGQAQVSRIIRRVRWAHVV